MSGAEEQALETSVTGGQLNQRLSSYGRYRSAGLSVAAGAIERMAAMAASIFRVRVVVQAVGAGAYGTWLAVIGLVQTGTMLHGGTPYAFVHHFAEASLDPAGTAMRRLLSTGFYLYCLVALLASAIGYGLLVVVPPEWLPGVSGGASETRRLLAICIGGVFACLPLSLFSTVLVGLQRQYVVSAWRSGTAVVQVVLLWTAVYLSWSSMPALAMVLVISDVASAALLAAAVIWRTGFRPRLHDVDLAFAKSIFIEGTAFLAADAGNWLKLGLPVLLIASAVGPVQLAQFAVVLQLCQTCVGFIALAGTSLWPAYSQSAALGDKDWLAEAFTKVSATSLLLSGWAGAMLIVLGPIAVRIWLHGRIVWLPSVAMLLAFWMVGQVFVSSAAAFLSGVSRSRQMGGIVLTEGVAVAAASAMLVRWFGESGVAAAMAVAVFASSSVLLLAVGEIVSSLTTGPLLRSLSAALVTVLVSSVLIMAMSANAAIVSDLMRAGLALLITACQGCLAWYYVATPARRKSLVDLARASAIAYRASTNARFTRVK